MMNYLYKLHLKNVRSQIPLLEQVISCRMIHVRSIRGQFWSGLGLFLASYGSGLVGFGLDWSMTAWKYHCVPQSSELKVHNPCYSWLFTALDGNNLPKFYKCNEIITSDLNSSKLDFMFFIEPRIENGFLKLSKTWDTIQVNIENLFRVKMRIEYQVKIEHWSLISSLELHFNIKSFIHVQEPSEFKWVIWLALTATKQRYAWS